MKKNRINIVIVVTLFLVLNVSTMNGMYLGDESIIIFTTLLGIIAMPVLCCFFLYKDAIENKQRHFLKGFVILAILYLLTNVHALFGEMDGHGRAVYNLIIITGLLVVILSSIVAEIALTRAAKSSEQES